MTSSVMYFSSSSSSSIQQHPQLFSSANLIFSAVILVVYSVKSVLQVVELIKVSPIREDNKNNPVSPLFVCCPRNLKICLRLFLRLFSMQWTGMLLVAGGLLYMSCESNV